MNARILLLVLSLGAATAAGSEATSELRLDVAPADVRTEEAAAGRRTVRSWSWGVLVTDAGLTPRQEEGALVLPLLGELTVHGPRDAEGRAPLTLLADGVVLCVDGDADFRSRDGITRVGPPKADFDPRAAVAIFLAMLILTALMFRQTRRSLAGR